MNHAPDVVINSRLTGTPLFFVHLICGGLLISSICLSLIQCLVAGMEVGGDLAG